MKKKTRGALLCVASLLILGSAAAVVGVGSEGFKNWDTNDWFQKNDDTNENLEGTISVDEDNESQPVLFKVNNLSSYEDVVDMSNVVITASTDGSIEECHKFIFSFSVDISYYATYQTTDNTITINFTKKPNKKIYLYATTTGSAISHRGSLGIDFIKTLERISFLDVSKPNVGITVDGNYKFILLDLYKIEENLIDGFNIHAFYENAGTINEVIIYTYEFESTYNIFDDAFESNKLKFNFADILEEIYGDNKFQGDEGYGVLGKLSITGTGSVSEIADTLETEIRVVKKSITEGGVDMGDDIVVG